MAIIPEESRRQRVSSDRRMTDTVRTDPILVHNRGRTFAFPPDTPEDVIRQDVAQANGDKMGLLNSVSTLAGMLAGSGGGGGGGDVESTLRHVKGRHGIGLTPDQQAQTAGIIQQDSMFRQQLQQQQRELTSAELQAEKDRAQEIKLEDIRQKNFKKRLKMEQEFEDKQADKNIKREGERQLAIGRAEHTLRLEDPDRNFQEWKMADEKDRAALDKKYVEAQISELGARAAASRAAAGASARNNKINDFLKAVELGMKLDMPVDQQHALITDAFGKEVITTDQLESVKKQGDIYRAYERYGVEGLSAMSDAELARLNLPDNMVDAFSSIRRESNEQARQKRLSEIQKSFLDAQKEVLTRAVTTSISDGLESGKTLPQILKELSISDASAFVGEYLTESFVAAGMAPPGSRAGERMGHEGQEFVVVETDDGMVMVSIPGMQRAPDSGSDVELVMPGTEGTLRGSR